MQWVSHFVGEFKISTDIFHWTKKKNYQVVQQKYRNSGCAGSGYNVSLLLNIFKYLVYGWTINCICEKIAMWKNAIF